MHPELKSWDALVTLSGGSLTLHPALYVGVLIVRDLTNVSRERSDGTPSDDSSRDALQWLSERGELQRAPGQGPSGVHVI